MLLVGSYLASSVYKKGQWKSRKRKMETDAENGNGRRKTEMDAENGKGLSAAMRMRAIRMKPMQGRNVR